MVAWRLWTGWRIVPSAVKLRLGLQLGLGGAALLAGLFALTRWWPTAQPGVLVPPLGLLAGLLGYALWCLLPDLQQGIPPSLRGDLPCPPGQRVRLSFDDGPVAGVTDAVLDLLAAHGLRASFFLLSHKARNHPALVRRIVAEGHVLGLHGEDHRPVLFQSTAALTAKLRRARDDLAQLAGQPITLYRPSHGFKNRALLRALRRLDLRLVSWDFGVWDTDAPAPAVLLQRLRLCTTQPPGGPPPIVLLHDGRDDLPGLPPHHRSLLAALTAWLPSARESAGGGEQRL
ncbi:MAG TPA: polysaccharide deacetylase family protein [Pseudomonadota bacterium]|nr:polysaccharide deacetylase family protein [Pseudomonadota bacterium]